MLIALRKLHLTHVSACRCYSALIFRSMDGFNGWSHWIKSMDQWMQVLLRPHLQINGWSWNRRRSLSSLYRLPQVRGQAVHVPMSVCKCVGVWACLGTCQGGGLKPAMGMLPYIPRVCCPQFSVFQLALKQLFFLYLEQLSFKNANLLKRPRRVPYFCQPHLHIWPLTALNWVALVDMVLVINTYHCKEMKGKDTVVEQMCNLSHFVWK